MEVCQGCPASWSRGFEDNKSSICALQDIQPAMKFMFSNGKMASWRYVNIYVLYVAFTISCHIALHHIISYHIISYHVFLIFGITVTFRHVESMSRLSCGTMKSMQVWLHLLVQLCIEQLEPWKINHWDSRSYHVFFGSHKEIQELGRCGWCVRSG